MSKRVKKAVDRLANDGKESEEEVEKPKRRRTRKAATEGEKKPRAQKKKAVGDSEKPKAVKKQKSEGSDTQRDKPQKAEVKRKSTEGEVVAKPKVARRRKTKDGEDQSIPEVKSPYFEEDVIPQKKKHEADILQNREKAAEILRNLRGKK